MDIAIKQVGGVDLAALVGDNADALAVVPAGVWRKLAENMLYNGASFDRQRGNTETGSLVTVATSSANGADQTNYNARGIQVVVDITAITGTNIVVTIQGKDPTSGKYFTLLASAALTGTGTTVLTVYPGCIAAANSVANLPLPRTWRVITTNTAISAITATVAGSMIV